MTTTKRDTPSPPGSIIIRTFEGDPILTEEDQEIYQSGVGSLLYLINNSRPDIANSVRGLSMVMEKAH